MNSYKKLIYIIILAFIILLFYSCASPVEDEIRYTTYIVTNYLLKAKQILLYIIFLLDTEKKYWINIYSKLYYFYFTLARIKSFLQQNKLSRNDHKEIWSLASVEPKKVFGEEFKKIRVECDYNIIKNEEKFIEETNDIIINKHKKTFYEQINDVKIFYHRRIEQNKKIDDIISEIEEKYDIMFNKISECNKNLFSGEK